VTSHDRACPGTLPNGELCEGEHGDCPGRGRCHGCMVWCERCGDTFDVCDSFACQRHRCTDCHNVLAHAEFEFNAVHTNEWWKWCFTCWIKRGVVAARERDPENEISTLEVLCRAVDRYRNA
jgi:hypothetical protein